MKINRFEDIESWKMARKLNKKIYNITSQREFARDWGLRDQIQRASVSIMNNIAEGFDSSSKTEFCRFLSYSKRSCSEVQCIMYIALDLNYVDEELFQEIYSQAQETRKLISGFVRYLQGRK